MAAREEHASSEVLRGLTRHLNCLNEDNKATRKRAIEQIKKETIDKNLSSGVLQEVFTVLLKPLLKCLSDPMEKCRETAITILLEFIRCVPRPEESLPYLMPCLAQRFGEKDIVESAEELRLSALEMLTLTVEVCGKHLAPYLNEMINILQRSIIDPFPDVKRESCKCTIQFAKSVPEHFHMQAESLVQPLMQTVSHQHSRVRVSVIEATGAVIQYGTGKNLNDVASHLAQRLFDDSPQVRKAVTVVVGDWLLHLRDRYSYFHTLIPLLLTNISDDIPEIKLLASDLWWQVGAQWEKENEEDIKDKMDFLLTPPPFYPSEVTRPGLGCRELVVRNLSRLVPAITHDVTDWLVATRVRTSQLLSVLLLHAEDHCTQHLQPLLAMLYRACTDTEKDVVNNCLAAAKLLGTFVPPAVFLRLMLDHVTSPSASHPWAHLMVLAAVLRGCPKPLLKPHLEEVANTLARQDVCQEYTQVVYLEQLLACVEVLLDQCDSECSCISLQLLKILVTIQSLSTEPQLTEKVRKSIIQIVCDFLSGIHTVMTSQWQRQKENLCVAFHRQKCRYLRSICPVIGEFVSHLMQILLKCLQPEKDPEMKMSILTMLAKLLLEAPKTLDSQGFLCDILLPNLVWRAGRTAAAVRTAAISCLLALLHGGAITPAQVLCVEEKLSPPLLSALEEDSQMARLLTCRSVSAMIKLVGPSLHPEALNKIYPELLKRLDDSSEEVRAVALEALGLWFSGLSKEYSPELCAGHLQFIFQQLLLHLDDPDSAVQDQVLEVLKKGSPVHLSLLKTETEAVRDKQRCPMYCDRLLEHILSLTTQQSTE
uniref:Dynein axonemal assembly factor 5 n=1 Tax=Neogobius melanostomus TaxID=47308 RepID=A0A8C6TRS7_9GOBI